MVCYSLSVDFVEGLLFMLCSKSKCIFLTLQKEPAGDSTEESKIKLSSSPGAEQVPICGVIRLEEWSWKGYLSLYIVKSSQSLKLLLDVGWRRTN